MRLLPHHIHIGKEAGAENQVWPLADRLIGNGDVATLRVSGVGVVSHGNRHTLTMAHPIIAKVSQASGRLLATAIPENFLSAPRGPTNRGRG